ncbi:hypothetical protein GGR53DRAFT_462886 [Hypoxylon sp. FL1150]|nr:hypothetical protein GGR53DRAFT_462886 [Hypoxylon sp. FL1150]
MKGSNMLARLPESAIVEIVTSYYDLTAAENQEKLETARPTILGCSDEAPNARAIEQTQPTGMHTAATIGVILVPVGLIAVMLAIWYCPFQHARPRDHGVEAGNTSTEQQLYDTQVSRASTVANPDTIARPEMVAYPSSFSYTAPPSGRGRDAHQSSRLSRISEEDHGYHHHHHHHHLFGFHK